MSWDEQPELMNRAIIGPMDNSKPPTLSEMVDELQNRIDRIQEAQDSLFKLLNPVLTDVPVNPQKEGRPGNPTTSPLGQRLLSAITLLEMLENNLRITTRRVQL